MFLLILLRAIIICWVLTLQMDMQKTISVENLSMWLFIQNSKFNNLFLKSNALYLSLPYVISLAPAMLNKMFANLFIHYILQLNTTWESGKRCFYEKQSYTSPAYEFKSRYSKDTQDIFYWSTYQPALLLCVWKDHETYSFNCLPRSIFERCKAWRLKEDVHTLHIPVCSYLLDNSGVGVWESLTYLILQAKRNVEKEVKHGSVDAKTSLYLTDIASVFTGPEQIWMAQSQTKPLSRAIRK